MKSTHRLSLASRSLAPCFCRMRAIHPQPELTEYPEARRARLAREAKLIEDARASVARAGTVPFEEAEAWVESWDTPNELPTPRPRK